MSSPPPSDPLLTLEPLLDAVREGLEAAGWQLSGFQKTTSYEFEGRWAGDSSRSAYLFFHRDGLPDWASIDVFLDETSRGLKGNLALVLDGPELSEIPDPARALGSLAAVALGCLPEGFNAPVTLRYRLPDAAGEPGEADTEIRFKVLLPKKSILSGSPTVSSLAGEVALAFQRILESPGLRPYWPEGDSSWSLGV